MDIRRTEIIRDLTVYRAQWVSLVLCLFSFLPSSFFCPNFPSSCLFSCFGDWSLGPRFRSWLPDGRNGWMYLFSPLWVSLRRNSREVDARGRSRKSLDIGREWKTGRNERLESGESAPLHDGMLRFNIFNFAIASRLALVGF